MAKIATGKEMIKILTLLGFFIDRQKGSHVVMKKGSLIIVIPVHNNDQLKLGLFKAILKDIEMSEKDFWEIK